MIHDRITFQPRLPLRLAAPVLQAGIGAFFSHRHRRLQRHFAATSGLGRKFVDPSAECTVIRANSE